MNLTTSIIAASPAIALGVTGFVVVALGLFLKNASRYVFLAVSLLGLIISAGLAVNIWDQNLTGFSKMILADNFALVFYLLFIVSAILSMLLAMGSHEQQYMLFPEYFSVTLFATVGMGLMAASSNLLIIFLGLETLSISLYVLAAMKRTNEASLESAFKYFLLGAFSSSFLLYGIALVYGASGGFDLSNIAQVLSAGATGGEHKLLLIGGLLIVIGLGFKVALFPFHMWAPDVYQGAPTPITAFMSTGSKAAGFAAMLRILFTVTDGAAQDWNGILSVLAVSTMFVGNISALRQQNIKRMLAYSSIAHAGYILVGIVAWNETGAAGVIFYLLAYTFMNIGAFGALSFLSSEKRDIVARSDIQGLASSRPITAFLIATFMFALAGLPPTAGFMGKFYLFSAAVKAGHVWLVILGVINSMISLYYYLGIVISMYMRSSDKTETYARPNIAIAISLALAVTASLGLGLFPSFLMNTFEKVVSVIL